MYNFTEYRLHYFQTIGNLVLYSKNEVTYFNVNIADSNNFRFFNYKTKLLESTKANENNGIIKTQTISILLKYSRNI